MLICNRSKILLKTRILTIKLKYIKILSVHVYFSKTKVVGFSNLDIYINVQKSKTEKSLVFTIFFNKIFTFQNRLHLCFGKKQNKKVKKTKIQKTKKVQNKITHFFFFTQLCNKKTHFSAFKIHFYIHSYRRPKQQKHDYTDFTKCVILKTPLQ